MNRVLSISVLLMIPGCRSAFDCGVYVFDEASQLCVCPAGTVEQSGRRVRGERHGGGRRGPGGCRGRGRCLA